ncbi:MAG: hypothetical protein H7Z10_05170 [Gemmatimonadaceae bacterium]|nr:hypothetical protein [Acetobacteraceae bacterium]
MKVSVPALTAVLALSFGASAMAQTSRAPTDTGNMAYPAPLPQGNIGSTALPGSRAPTDTGNMAYPDPLPQGNIGTTRVGPGGPTDTGNMAYPAPLPQGNVGTTNTPR